MRDWPCYWDNRRMTKDEFLEVMNDIDWENDSVYSIFEELVDATHWYDDGLQDKYLDDFYNEGEAKNYTETVMNNYGLYTTATLLSKLKPNAGYVYIYRDGYFEDVTKEDLKQTYDEMMKWVEEYGE